MREKPPIDAQIAQIAARQHGHITRPQLLGVGLSPRAIDARVAAGKLIRVHRGVYAVGHRQSTPIARAHAAVLACGDDAFLSHASAAALWGFQSRWPKKPEVTAPHDRRRPGITAHRTITLLPGDITVNYGMPTSTVIRTIIDIQGRLTDRHLIRAINDARLANHLKPTALQELLHRCPRARRLIDPTQKPTRSSLEDEFMGWIARHHLPVPQINSRRNGNEVDAIFVAERVIVELDGWAHHNDYKSFHTDRTRDRTSAANGFLPLRYTRDDLTDPEADRLRGILASRR